MGKGRYVFRLDDISPDMDFNKFYRFKEILDKYDVKPIIGVIPANADRKLKEIGSRGGVGVDTDEGPEVGIDETQFWSMVRHLNWEKGWSVALHGFNHVYNSKSSGLLKYHNRSEFAGNDRALQQKKIIAGKEVLAEKGLKISAFMAPAHTFDKITLEVLRENGIDVITDGYGLYSYIQEGITFVPQLFARPRKMPFGVYTFCFHTDELTDKDFIEAEKFLSDNWTDVITFEDAVKLTADSWLKKALNFIVSKGMVLRGLIRLRGTNG